MNGYIALNNQKYAFHLENHIVKVFTDTCFDIFGTRTDVPEYLLGSTDTNYDILIKTGEAKTIARYTNIVAPLYFVGTANMHGYDLTKVDRIDFCGGSINSVYEQNILFETDEHDLCVDTINRGFALKFRPMKDVTKEYKIKVANYDVKLQLRFAYNVRRTNTKNNKLGEVNTCLSFIFDNQQSIDVFQECYRLVNKIVSLLNLQSNVRAEKIFTYQRDARSGMIKTSEAFVAYNKNENFVYKDSTKAIPFLIFDDNFEQFISVLQNDEFSTGFLPNKNGVDDFVDYDMVRNLCTALEFEFQKLDPKVEKYDKVLELANSVKNMIKEYKTCNPDFSEKFYNYIFTNIQTWSFPAAEQYRFLYENYQKIFDKLFSDFRRKNVVLDMSIESFTSFVKLRNKIVHGEHPPITQQNANFAYAMKVLVYICLLKRVGLNDDIVFEALNTTI